MGFFIDCSSTFLTVNYFLKKFYLRCSRTPEWTFDNLFLIFIFICGKKYCLEFNCVFMNWFIFWCLFRFLLLRCFLQNFHFLSFILVLKMVNKIKIYSWSYLLWLTLLSMKDKKVDLLLGVSNVIDITEILFAFLIKLFPTWCKSTEKLEYKIEKSDILRTLFGTLIAKTNILAQTEVNYRCHHNWKYLNN